VTDGLTLGRLTSPITTDTPWGLSDRPVRAMSLHTGICSVSFKRVVYLVVCLWDFCPVYWLAFPFINRQAACELARSSYYCSRHLLSRYVMWVDFKRGNFYLCRASTLVQTAFSNPWWLLLSSLSTEDKTGLLCRPRTGARTCSCADADGARELWQWQGGSGLWRFQARLAPTGRVWTAVSSFS